MDKGAPATPSGRREPDPQAVPSLRASVPSAGAILPCPFCGGQASVIGIRDGRQVSCKGQPRVYCFAKGPAVFHGPGGWDACEAEAIAAWNTRAPAALPEYGDWLPDVWDAYLRDLVGWENRRNWANLPATFRWHEFHERLAQAIEARRAETLGSACESAVGKADAPKKDHNHDQR